MIPAPRASHQPELSLLQGCSRRLRHPSRDSCIQNIHLTGSAPGSRGIPPVIPAPRASPRLSPSPTRAQRWRGGACQEEEEALPATKNTAVFLHPLTFTSSIRATCPKLLWTQRPPGSSGRAGAVHRELHSALGFGR